VQSKFEVRDSKPLSAMLVFMAAPLQIKDDTSLPVRGAPAFFSLDVRSSIAWLSIDDRRLPIAPPSDGLVERIARSVARVPKALRHALTGIKVSPVPNPADAMWAERYGLPVLSGMGADAAGSGWVFIYPHAFERPTDTNDDGFVRGLMHELGHCWSLRDWSCVPTSKEAWRDAIASDRVAPSMYADLSYRNSGQPDEDAAEATALYFSVVDTPALKFHRDRMPARFALLDARFERSDE